MNRSIFYFLCFFFYFFQYSYAETAPPTQRESYVIGKSFFYSWAGVIAFEDSPKEVCEDFLEYLTWGENPVYHFMGCWRNTTFEEAMIGSTNRCADGTYAYFNMGGLCEPFYTCPNSSWQLSDQICTRPDDYCWRHLENVSEEKLLAALVYAESSNENNYKEMAGIASAAIRIRDTHQNKSILDLVRNFPTFSYVVYNGNPRFRDVMCSSSKSEFSNAYKAAKNALNYGIDYANGACFWDGVDLKSKGNRHYRYKQGFKFTNEKHNIYHVASPPPLGKSKSKGSYNYKYESTAAEGGTIFWKLNNDFLKTEGKKQCR